MPGVSKAHTALFSLKGSTAAATFSEANMSTVAYALRDQGARYAGTTACPPCS